MSPLCKVCNQDESTENRTKLELLLNYGATCALALPDYHPIYFALEKKNFTALRLLFRECPDAIHSLQNFKFINDKPLLVEVAKANNTELLNEVMREWTTELKSRDQFMYSEAYKLKLDPRKNEFSSPQNQAQYLSVFHKDENGFGIFH